MRRREFITFVGGAAAAFPLAAKAQQSDQRRRIGVLTALAKDDPENQARLAGFRYGLERRGWSEGRNLSIDYRFAPAASPDQAQPFAKELVALRPDVIFASTTPVVTALQRETRAVIPMPDLSSYSDLHGVSINDFGASEDDVFQGAPVLVLGYPPVIGEWPLSSPIARSGIVAWTDPSDRLGQPFLIDANVFPGNSGSPVFHIRTGLGRFGGFTIGGGFALIGILAAVSEQDITITTQPLLGVPSRTMVPMKGLGGIGQIEPASKAKRLVQQHCQPAK